MAGHKSLDSHGRQIFKLTAGQAGRWPAIGRPATSPIGGLKE
jgi:hypothetical protein